VVMMFSFAYAPFIATGVPLRENRKSQPKQQ